MQLAVQQAVKLAVQQAVKWGLHCLPVDLCFGSQLGVVEVGVLHCHEILEVNHLV